MSIRAASVVVGFVFIASVPALAQGPGQPSSYPQLVAQIADLQARVAKLEGNIVASDLAGTYFVVVYSTDLHGSNANPPRIADISTSTIRADLTLNADGTGQISPSAIGGGALCEGSTLTLAGAMHAAECETEGSGNLTWTYAGGVVTITFDDGDQLPFSVALGGRFLILAFSPFHAPDGSDHALFIASRLR